MNQNRILVTGAAGFLGANLTRALLERGYAVTGLDNLSHGERANLHGLPEERFAFVEGDVRDPGAVAAAAAGANCVVHLAELKIPRYGDSLETLEVNVEGTANCLAAAQGRGARFILGSTDEVYGKNAETPLNEESALVMGQTDVNRWSLGVSKLMAEQFCFAYRDKYGLPITILRYFGGFGPHQPLDWRGGAQSVFVRAALRGEEIPIHGDGLQQRVFTHVDDLVRGTILALESEMAVGEIINLASTAGISIINFAYLVWRLAGAKGKPTLKFVQYTDFSRGYEDVRHRVADIAKARYLLGYEPEVEFEDGLRRTIAWCRNRMETHA